MAVKGLSKASVTVTITDHTKGPFALNDLLGGGSVTGVTVAPAAGYGSIYGPKCAYFNVQAEGPGKLYVGDSNVKNDGSRQGAFLQAADNYTGSGRQPYNAHDLRDEYVMTDTDNCKFDLDVEYA